MERKKIEFKSEASGTVFEATVESDRAPEASFFQWVTGLPEALRTPGVTFHNTKGPGMYTLTVGLSTKTGGIVTREDGAVLCQITGVVSQSVIDEFVAANPDLGKAAQKAGVAETTFRSETPLTGKKP